MAGNQPGHSTSITGYGLVDNSLLSSDVSLSVKSIARTVPGRSSASIRKDSVLSSSVLASSRGSFETQDADKAVILVISGSRRPASWNQGPQVAVETGSNQQKTKDQRGSSQLSSGPCRHRSRILTCYSVDKAIGPASLIDIAGVSATRSDDLSRYIAVSLFLGRLLSWNDGWLLSSSETKGTKLGSRANQKKQNAGFEQIPLRDVGHDEYSRHEGKMRQRSAQGRNPTKVVSDPSSQLQTDEMVHGNTSCVEL